MHRQIIHLIVGHSLHHGIQRIHGHSLAGHIDAESPHFIERIIPYLSLGQAMFLSYDLQKRYRSPAYTRIGQRYYDTLVSYVAQIAFPPKPAGLLRVAKINIPCLCIRDSAAYHLRYISCHSLQMFCQKFRLILQGRPFLHDNT